MEQQALKSSIELINSPLDLINYWDFFLVILSSVVRLLFVMRLKAMELSEKKKQFSFKMYFDGKHTVRWLSHVVTGLSMLLILPEIFTLFVGPKYFPELSNWSFTADFIIGFLGYDLIKLLEKIIKPYIDKFIKNDTDQSNSGRS